MSIARRVAIILSIAVIFALSASGADKSRPAAAVGSIVGTRGSVLVDRQPAIAKEAVFAGDVLSTGAASGAYLSLGGTTAILAENAEVTLDSPARSATMTLLKGAVVVRTGGPGTARVNVPGAFVLVSGNGSSPASVRIAAVNEAAVVVADRGQAEVHGTGAPAIVRSGSKVLLEHGVPQANSSALTASVYKQIPSGFLYPPSDKAPPLAPSQHKLADKEQFPVGSWVVTPAPGRVQVLLGDGSYLNVGTGSEMHVIRHDASTHQTELELAAGSMKASILKATGTMQCGNIPQKVSACAHTPTAVIGVTGTELNLDIVSATNTNVANVSQDSTSLVHVGAVNPSVPTIVTLHPGQFVHVFPNGFSAVGGLTASLAKSLQNKTNVKGGLTGPAGAAGAAGGAANVATSTAGSVGGAGAAGVGAGLGGLAISHMNSALTSLNQAATGFSNAVTSLNSASSSATQATNSANETTNQINNQQQGCGCASTNEIK